MRDCIQLLKLTCLNEDVLVIKKAKTPYKTIPSYGLLLIGFPA